jgi:hypothetical protein
MLPIASPNALSVCTIGARSTEGTSAAGICGGGGGGGGRFSTTCFHE